MQTIIVKAEQLQHNVSKSIANGNSFAFMIYLSLKTVRMTNFHNYERKLFELDYFRVHRPILMLFSK